MRKCKTIPACVAAFLFTTSLVFGLGRGAFADQQGKPQKLCPVLGGEIDRSVHADYQGERVYFCCPGCIDTFKKSPEKYLGKMKAEGIVLHKTRQAMKDSMKMGKGGEAGESGMGHPGHTHDMGGMY